MALFRRSSKVDVSDTPRCTVSGCDRPGLMEFGGVGLCGGHYADAVEADYEANIEFWEGV